MVESFASSLFAAVLAAVVGGAPPGALAPIHLLAEPSGEGVHIRVVGSADSAFDALYTLEVSSDVARGGNSSVQRGRARLRPGEAVTLISLRLGDVVPGRWEARLLVEPAGGEPYREVRNSL